MKIAIIGAGFSGLATAWTLLQDKHQFEVVLIDGQGIGAGASGVAAGLMHPFAGAHSKLNHWGREGFTASLELLKASEKALERSPYKISGILRPTLFPIQVEEFKTASEKYPEEIQWLSQEEAKALIPGIVEAPGILIKKGITVYPEVYLQGLWLACKELGAVFALQKINSLAELSDFDAIVVAMGAHCSDLKELSKLPLSYTKGQILELEWPEGLPPLPMPLNSQIYCVMHPDNKRCLAGSTYERNFISSAIDVGIAKKEICPKLSAIYPPLREAKIINCHSGIRVSAPQHLPLLKQVNSRCIVLTGMGSKGLLYHALFAQRLTELLLTF
ncbi:MAG: FAD-binding oxidoreductase [Parachlamydiaceae bacterium]|nr:FAD-binding oxidoreductase [Parachlamydiaceae bacterium]